MDAFEVFGMPEADEPAPSTVRSGWEVYVGDGVQFERVAPADIGLAPDSEVSSIPVTLRDGQILYSKIALVGASRALRALAEVAAEIEAGRTPWRSIENVRSWVVGCIDEALPHISYSFPGQASIVRTIRELIANGLRGRVNLQADAYWFSMMASRV